MFSDAQALLETFVCLFVCLFVGIKPEKSYSDSCVGREVNPLGHHSCGACPFNKLPTLNTLWYVDTLAKCRVSAYWANTRGPPRVSRFLDFRTLTCTAEVRLWGPACCCYEVCVGVRQGAWWLVREWPWQWQHVRNFGFEYAHRDTFPCWTPSRVGAVVENLLLTLVCVVRAGLIIPHGWRGRSRCARGSYWTM